MRYKKLIQQATCLLLFMTQLFPLVSAQTIPLTAETWQVIDNENNQQLDLQIAEYKGKTAVHLGRHEIATLKTGEYENFILEMEVAGKAMPGIGFRAEDLWNYEFFYCRVFSGGKSDALQYIPVYNGAHPWQLYNEPVDEAPAIFQPEEWFRVKLEVYGQLMRVYVGDAITPNLELELLHDKLTRGKVFLKTSFAEAYFSNIKITELDTPFSIKPIGNDQKYLTDWKISEQITGNPHSQRQYYQWLDQAKKEHQWQQIKTDKRGVVNLAKYFEHPRAAVFAETTIPASEEKTVNLAFDFTQVLLIALNGEILFHGRELDTGNFMRVMTGEQTIPLSLDKGDNQLTFWIRSDDEWQESVNNPAYLGRKQAMNWGFIAHLEE